jgi:hypothetical protein
MPLGKLEVSVVDNFHPIGKVINFAVATVFTGTGFDGTI